MDDIVFDESIRIVDLCAGTHGFSIAFKSVSDRFITVFSNDNDHNCKSFHLENKISNKFVCKDIHDLKLEKIPEHDILTSGFPCQPFSIAGNQKGFEDKRSNVFWKILDIIEFHKPRIVLLENVKNLKTHDKENTFKVITESLIDIGYHIKYKIINTSSYLPQNRERIYIICFKYKDDHDKFDFLEGKKENIKILEEDVADKYYYTDKLKVYNTIKSQVIKTDVYYQYRRHYVRENKSGVCPALTANMGSGGHNVPLIKDKKGIRKLTPRECFNLQGFPKDIKLKQSDSVLYKLCGNAISIPIVKDIARQILKLL